MKNIFLSSLFFFSTFVYSNEAPLLDDTKEIQEYVASFPINDYKICAVKTVGKFYIDDIDDMVKNFLRQGVVWEQNIVDNLKKYIKKGSVVVDIGAHIGVHTITMAKSVGPNGFVLAFEPQKKIYRELIANCILNNMQDRVGALRYAVGNMNKIVEMHPSIEGNEAGTPIGIGGDLVEMRTLDSFNLQNVSLIKLDAEGSEDIVLNGAEQTIVRNRPVIIIEICGGWNYDTAPDSIKAMINHTKQKLNLLGYHVFQLGFHDYLAIPK